MGSRSLPKNNEIVSATAYEKPPSPPPESGEIKFSGIVMKTPKLKKL